MDREQQVEDVLAKLDFAQFQLAVKERYAREGTLSRGERRAMQRQISGALDMYTATNGEPRAWETVLI